MPNSYSDHLTPISEQIRADFTARNATRDATLANSRELTRLCAETIRAVHRQEWPAADAKRAQAAILAHKMSELAAIYPDLYHSGYTQDALKEWVEANVMMAIIRHAPLPTPTALSVPSAAYLNGLAEAASELRRFILDIMRQAASHSDEAERLLDWMDAIYDQLVTFDFPDAITGDLRRRTDALRGVLERTRGDLTTSLREEKLRQALSRFEERL
jgi:translin